MIFLNEVLQEYRDMRMDTDKEAVIKDFISDLWKSKCGFKKETKYVSFNVDHGLFKDRPDLIELFERYNNIPYKICKSFYQKVEHIDFIKIKINNLYAYYVDKDVYCGKDYYSLLRKAKNEYFKTLKLIKEGVEEVDSHKIERTITDALAKADNIKKHMGERKIQISWSEYKTLINSYIVKIFNNYKTIDEYEEIHGWEKRVDAIWNEDNYIIRYFNRSLHGYIMMHIRDSKPKEEILKYCEICDIQLEVTSNRKKWCTICWNDKEKERKKRVWHSIKHKYKN
jgi:hypothetical protein